MGAEIKARLSEIVDKVEGQHERVTLTRKADRWTS